MRDRTPQPASLRPSRRSPGWLSEATPRERRAALTALAFLLPNLVGFLAFTLFPVLFSLWMAFTNWSLKPAVKREFVGLRNFVELLGLRPLQEGQPGLLIFYLLSALVAIGSGVILLWAYRTNRPGVRRGGGLVTAAGILSMLEGLKESSLVGIVVGTICLLVGIHLMRREEPEDKGGDFIVPCVAALLLVVSGFFFRGLQAPLGRAYAPQDPYFWQFFGNTAYLMLGIPLSIAGSLALALLLNERLPTGGIRQRTVGALLCLVIGLAMGGVLWGMGSPNAGLLCGILWGIVALGFGANVVAYRTLFYLPSFTAGVALMILWKALYNPKTGPINVGLEALFHALGWNIKGPEWLGDVDWAKPALIAMGVWTSIGGTNMLLYLAGLSNIPRELLDAAEVDGAGAWNRFQHVTWPQLAPTTFFITIMAIIGGLQGGFEQARVMTNGGPAGSTTTLSFYIYNKAFQDLEMGYAAAISWVLFIFVFAATALNWKFGKGLEVDG